MAARARALTCTLVTGGAGFIGSTLVDHLLARGDRVIVYDNFSTGRPQFLESARKSPAFELVEGDVLDFGRLLTAARPAEFVFHLAANADVRFGTAHPRRDHEQNALGTLNALEAARQVGVKGFALASTGAVYGEPSVFPTPEDAPFPVQTSLYGASKLAAEGLVAAYGAGFGMRTWIFRLVSVLGERYTHGHVFDFCRSLLADPTGLDVLGDGRQRKSYIHVQDCVAAMLWAVENAPDHVNVVNIGLDETCDVKQSIGWICRRLGVTPTLRFRGGTRGWVGDSPLVHLDTRRIRALGWSPRYTVPEAVESTADWLLANRWVFERR